ncbi:antitoxin Xre/MbcA/ParS toxin-binding domain-containing protein [Pseudomonas protegens]|uniref:antitoxin Xre/MbcA/ParS toxin-binding domain-containing protein n=1 Tax=Pseudomonas protegens TaxID=380021 RepID=UPI00200E2886|nr:antitoxin Xre/MbcA/ParS toxin-binding domain-containing protein [Pseudomonas protegens]
MIGVEPRQVSSQQPGCRPTTYLTQSQSGLLSPLDLFLRVRQGFALNDVQAMVAASELYSAAHVLRRITGKSKRTLARQRDDGGTLRLNAQQSAVAFQYAQVLEHAASVFGSQQRAEKWLGRPCKHLENNVPLELIENAFGFQVVEAYLQRIELGVYQ